MKIAVVGCTHAGTAAVQEILTRHPDTIVDVFERRADISFLSCGIALYLEGTVDKLSSMFYADAEGLEAMGPNVHVHLRHDVIDIDAKRHVLQIQNMLTHSKFSQTYDKLIMTTGSYPVIPPLQGISLPHVLMCKNADDAEKIKASAETAKTIAIVGGGYIGVELAEAYSRIGRKVIFINGVHGLLSHYVDDDLRKLVSDELQAHGVTTFFSETALRFDSDGKQAFIQTDKAEHVADLAVVCVGFRAMTELLQGQVDTMPNGAIHVNDYMQTSDPDIYAAGDSCAVHFNPTGHDAYAPLATNAVRQGKLAGRNVFGNTIRYMGTQSTSAMRLYDQTLACTGMTLHRALQAGLKAASVTVSDSYRPEFMPDAYPIHMVLVYNEKNREILGAQFLSRHEISQAANLISVMIQNHNTIDDLAYVDMLFNPWYDKPWNYLNILGQQAVTQADAL